MKDHPNASTPPFSIFTNWEKISRNSISPLQKRDRFTLFSTLFSYTPNPNCDFCNKNIPLFSDYLIYLDHTPVILCEECSIENSTCKNCMSLIPFSQYTETLPFCKFCKKSTQCHCCSDFFLAQNTSRISYIPGIFCQKCLDQCTPCVFCRKLKHDNNMSCSFCQRSSKPQAIENIAKVLLNKILCFFPFKTNHSDFPQEKFIFSSSKKYESLPMFPSKSSLQIQCHTHIPLHFFVMQGSMLWFSILIKNAVPKINSEEILLFTCSLLTKNFLRDNNIHIRNCLLPNFWTACSSKEFILFQKLSNELGLPRLLQNLQENLSLEEIIVD